MGGPRDGYKGALANTVETVTEQVYFCLIGSLFVRFCQLAIFQTYVQWSAMG